MRGEYLEKANCKTPKDHLLFWMSASWSVIGTSPRNAGRSGSQKTDIHPLHIMWYPVLKSSARDSYRTPVCKNPKQVGNRVTRARVSANLGLLRNPRSFRSRSCTRREGGLSLEFRRSRGLERRRLQESEATNFPRMRLWKRSTRCRHSTDLESRPFPEDGAGTSA